MLGASDFIEAELSARLRELGDEVDVHVHEVDVDAERLVAARGRLDYWTGRCRGRAYEAQRDIEALVDLCQRPANRRSAQRWSIERSEGRARADVTYLVWRA